jgi:serralysin
MANPVVEHFDTTVFLNSTIFARDLVELFHPDGKDYRFIQFEDYQSAETTGFFRLNGVAIPNGTQFRVSFDELENGLVEYVGGSTIGWEGFRAIAFDVDGNRSTTAVSGRVYTVRENVTRPIVFDRPITALADELIPLGPFLQGRDPDGYPISLWQVRDQPGNAGRIVIDGEVVESGVFHVVRNLDTVFYQTNGAAFTERLDKLNYDGELWSVVSSSTITSEPNVNRPVAQFTRGNANSNELIPMGPLTNITDDDENTIKWYEFWNTSPHSNTGNLVFKGVEQPRKSWIRVAAEELSELFYRAPDMDFLQQIRYRGFDGKFQSGNSTISITTEFVIPPTQPIIGNPELIYDQQLISNRIEDLFPQLDSGKPLVRYQFYDQNDFGQLSARFEYNTNKLDAKVIHDFSAGEVAANVRLRTGDYNNRSLDDMYVRAQNEDGLWTTWERLVVRTEPEYIEAHDDNNDWADTTYSAIPRDAEGRLVLTYSFMQDFPDEVIGEASDDDPHPENFTQLTQQARVNVRRAFDNFESLINVKYVEVSDQSTNVFGQRGGIFRFGNYGVPPDNADAVAYTSTPSFSPVASDVWYNRYFMGTVLAVDENGDPVLIADTDLEPGTFNYTVHLHELMHAHGYMHSYEDANGSSILPPATNSAYFSVLSIPGGSFRSDGLEQTTPQLYDVETLQRDYGINPNFNASDTLHSLSTTFSERPDFAETLWDAGGNDTLSLEGSDPARGFGFPNLIDLNPGSFSTFNGFEDNLSIAFRAEIENAIGSDLPDTLLGNYLSNVVDGGLGNDLIEGRAGDDTLTGGAGDDTFVFGPGDGDDVINEQRLAGRDTIQISEFGDTFLNEGDFTENFLFRKDGRDLIMTLELEDSSVTDGSIRIVNHAWGSYQIETLEFNGIQVDLKNLGQQATVVDQKFEITSNTSNFGNLVTPV